MPGNEDRSQLGLKKSESHQIVKQHSFGAHGELNTAKRLQQQLYYSKQSNTRHSQKRIIMRASTNLKEQAINRSLRTNDSVNEDYGFNRRQNADGPGSTNVPLLGQQTRSSQLEVLNEEAEPGAGTHKRGGQAQLPNRAKTSLKQRPLAGPANTQNLISRSQRRKVDQHYENDYFQKQSSNPNNNPSKYGVSATRKVRDAPLAATGGGSQDADMSSLNKDLPMTTQAKETVTQPVHTVNKAYRIRKNN